MSESEFAKIISKNLRNIAYEAGKSQADISHDLNINKATVSSWMNGTRIPRMDKIDLLCHYFNVTRRAIMEDQSTAQMEFHASKQEEALITAFRSADDLTKQMILRLLNIGPENKKSIDIA